jgi:hypothetical protein
MIMCEFDSVDSGHSLVKGYSEHVNQSTGSKKIGLEFLNKNCNRLMENSVVSDS